MAESRRPQTMPDNPPRMVQLRSHRGRVVPSFLSVGNEKAGLTSVTLTLVTVGSPAVFRIRFVKTRDFPPLSCGRFSFCYF